MIQDESLCMVTQYAHWVASVVEVSDHVDLDMAPTGLLLTQGQRDGGETNAETRKGRCFRNQGGRLGVNGALV